MHSFQLQAQNLSDVIKGELLQSNELEFSHVVLDSRRLVFPSKSIFFALPGSRHNGHDYIKHAYQGGIRCFVVSEKIELNTLKGASIILVSDSLQALQSLAAWHRIQFNLPVIGVTGSNGKTIVKEWLFQLLDPNYKIVRNPKSYNSQIGVPLSVLQIRNSDELGIFEAGISQSGEMERLENIISPSIGIITNIGHAHDEGFLNVRQKINEKLILFRRSDIIIYCSDQGEVNACIGEMKSKLGREDLELLSWGSTSNATLRVNSKEVIGDHSLMKLKYKDQDFEIELPFVNDASIENSMHCVLTMLHLGISPDVISKRVILLKQVAMRLELKEANNNCSVINDSYNSDLESLRIALDFMDLHHKHNKKRLVISDILQSGMDDFMLYKEVLDLLESRSIDSLDCIGAHISSHKVVFDTLATTNIRFFNDTAEYLTEFSPDDIKDETILLKGARAFKFELISQQLEKKLHHTRLEVNLNAVLENIVVYSKKLKEDTKVMAMVKAFSYGSGASEIANVLQYSNIDYLAVAYTDEGVALRRSGISLPIMVMNPDLSTFSSILKYDLEPEIYSLHQLSALKAHMSNSSNQKLNCHLKIDTGMHRLGFEDSDVEELIDELKDTENMSVNSIFSHLAASEASDLDGFTKEQIATFERISSRINTELGISAMRHILNSAGILRHPEYQYEMVRLGLGMYGIDITNTIQSELQNVGTLKTLVSQVKRISKGETVGYGRVGLAKVDMQIATIGIGYADGIDRRLSNGNGEMLIHGQRAKIVGNVCMDMCMLDVSGMNVKEGDEVIVFGQDLSVTEIAQSIDTIPYEVLTSISERVERVFFQE